MNAGEVSLDGSISLEPGPAFVPKEGDAFELLTYRIRQGTFASHLAPSPPLGLDWYPDYRSTSFVLKLVAPGGKSVGLGEETHGALRFDGFGDYTQIPHAEILNTYPMTLMAWVRTDRNAAQSDGLITKYADGSATGYALFLSEGRLRAWYYRDSSSAVGPGAGLDGGTIADAQWHHIAFVVDQNGGGLYVDGVLKVEQGWNGSARFDTGLAGPTTSQAPLQFGRFDQFANGFEGNLDEVILVNGSLSEAEIQRWKDRRVSTGDDSRFIGIWHFDEMAGTSSPDASGYENKAVLSGDTSRIPSDIPVSGP